MIIIIIDRVWTPPLFAHFALNIRPACQLLCTWFKLREARLFLFQLAFAAVELSLQHANYSFETIIMFIMMIIIISSSSSSGSTPMEQEPPTPTPET